jgi:hypothetical protein
MSMLPFFSRIIRENHEKMTGFELRAKKHGQHFEVETEEEIAKSSIIVIVFLPWLSKRIFMIMPRVIWGILL